MREVEDSPNRCPTCQRVQISSCTCPNCLAHADLLDVLEILEDLASGATNVLIRRKITSMREAIFQRG